MDEPRETNWNEELHQAIRNRDECAFGQALENGADVNARLGANYTTALHIAVPSAGYDFVQSLLRAGANPNNRTKRGFTPIFSAAGFLQPDFCNLLLDWGADPCIYTRSGTSNPPYDKQAIHEAVRKHKPETVRALLKAGADPLAVEGKTSQHCLEMIPDYAQEQYDFLHEAAALPRVTVDETLSKADLLEKDAATGLTPLDNPVTWRQWPEITAVLAGKGELFSKAELLAKNANGNARLLLGADTRMLRSVVGGLNEAGESLSMSELEAAGITANTEASQSSLFKQLASRTNIRLQGGNRFVQDLHTLPEEASADIPNRHQLAATARHITRDQGLQR